MKSFLAIAAVLFITLISGCASNPITPLSLSGDFYQTQGKKIGVYFDDLPETNTTFPGAGCLLCLAAAATANSSLTKHVKTLPNEELKTIKDEVKNVLADKGMQVISIDQPIDFKNLKKVKSTDKNMYFAPKDMRPLKEKYGVDELVVIDFSFVGVQRSYSSYIPNGGPLANVSGMLTMVNLDTNTYTIYQPISILVPVQGEWDEPPSFPGVTTSYYEALDRAKSQIIDTFRKE